MPAKRRNAMQQQPRIRFERLEDRRMLSTVAYYRFEEGTTNLPATGAASIKDVSGNGLHATPVNAPLYSDAVVAKAVPYTNANNGLALDFNGSNQRIAIADYSALMLTHSITVEAYINVRAIDGPSDWGHYVIFRGDDRNACDPYTLSVDRSNAGEYRVAFKVTQGDGHFAVVRAPILLNTWTHVAGTLDDATDSLRIYVNGVAQSSATTTVRPFGALTGNNPGLGIGGLQSDLALNQGFNGLIDEVRISDKALLPENFLNAVTAGLASAPLNLIGTSGNSQVVLTWQPPLSDGGSAVTDYIVQYSSNTGISWTTFPEGASTATTAAVSGLTNGTRYMFRVAAKNAAGVGIWAMCANAIIPVAPPSRPPGSTIGGVTKDGAITIAWEAPISDGGGALTDYIVQYSDDGGLAWATANRAASSDPCQTVSGLVNGKSYIFRVAAVNVAGMSNFSTASAPFVPVPVSWTSLQGVGTLSHTLADGSRFVYSTSGWVARVNADGSYAWSRALNVGIQDISGTPDGGAVFSGRLDYKSSAVFGSTLLTADDMSKDYVARMRADGVFEWAILCGGHYPTDFDDARHVSTAVACLVDDSTVVTGCITVSLTASFGTLSVSGNSQPQTYAARIARDGSFTWVRTWESMGPNDPGGGPVSWYSSVAPVGDGSVIVAAERLLNGERDPFIQRFTAGGALMWAIESPVAWLGTAGGSIDALSDGSFVAFGHRIDPAYPPDNGSLVVAKFDGNGLQMWKTIAPYADPVGAWAEPKCARLLPNGSVLLAGNFRGGGALNWGKIAFRGSNENEFFVTRVDSNGDVSWATRVGELAWTGNGGACSVESLSVLSDGTAVISGYAETLPLPPRRIVFGDLAYSLETSGGPFIGTIAYDHSIQLPPSAPTAVNVAAGDSKAELSWTAPNNNGDTPIVDYMVQYSSNGGTTWTTFAAGVSSATATTVSGLTNGVSYVFRVAAGNSAGFGAFAATQPLRVGVPGVPGTPYETPGISISPIFIPGDFSPPTWPAGIDARPIDRGAIVVWGTADPISLNPSDPKLKVTQYIVEYSADGKVWRVVPRSESDTRFQIVNELSNGVPYLFRVHGVNGYGESKSYSTTTNYVVPGQVVNPPFKRFAWNPPDSVGGGPIVGFAVEVSGDGGRSWSAASVGGPPTDYTNSATAQSSIAAVGKVAAVRMLAWNMPYMVRVAAINVYGQGPWSAPSVESTTGAAGATDAPTGLTSRVVGDSVSLSWQRVKDVVRYVIFLRERGSGEWRIASVADGMAAGQTLGVMSIGGLVIGRTYEFKVATVGKWGQWPESQPIVVTVSSVTASSPQKVSGTAGNEAAVLFWDAPSSSGDSAITNYLVQYRIVGGTAWSGYARAESTAKSASVTGLTNGTSYVFRVAAVNGAGVGLWSTVSAPVTPRTVPSAPRSLLVSAGNAMASVRWLEPWSNGGSVVTDYVVQYRKNGGAWTSFPDGKSTNAAATVMGLVNGTSYAFRVSAVNGRGSGAWTAASAWITPLAATPSRPVVVPGNGFVDLRWSAPLLRGVPPVTGYSIRYSTDDGATWTVSLGTPSPATSFRLAVANGKTYLFQVAPIVSGGVGVYSLRSTPVIPFSPTDKPDAPDGVRGAKSGRAVIVWWNPVAGNAGGPVADYIIQYRVSRVGSQWVTYRDTVTPDTSAALRLPVGVRYVFRVAARNAAGLSEFSDMSTPVSA